MNNILELFSIYLPIADVTVNMLILAALGIFTGVLAGMFGLGGGLIIVPVLTFMGIDYSVATASSTNQMTASSLSGYIAYARRNRVDYKLGLIMLIGGVFGSFCGTQLFHYLTKIGKLNFVVAACFALVLGVIGLSTLVDAIFLIYYKIIKVDRPKYKGMKLLSYLDIPFKITLSSCREQTSIISLIIVGFIGGILVSLLGIGGSLIMIPMMVYLLRVSDAFTAGTTHFQIIFTTILSTILHAYSGAYLDIVLSSILMLFTALGAQMGVKISSGFHPNNFRILLAVLVITLCAKVLFGLTATPKDMFVMEVVDVKK